VKEVRSVIGDPSQRRWIGFSEDDANRKAQLEIPGHCAHGQLGGKGGIHANQRVEDNAFHLEPKPVRGRTAPRKHIVQNPWRGLFCFVRQLPDFGGATHPSVAFLMELCGPGNSEKNRQHQKQLTRRLESLPAPH